MEGLKFLYVVRVWGDILSFSFLVCTICIRVNGYCPGFLDWNYHSAFLYDYYMRRAGIILKRQGVFMGFW